MATVNRVPSDSDIAADSVGPMVSVTYRIPRSWQPAIERVAADMSERVGFRVNASMVARIAIRELCAREGEIID